MKVRALTSFAGAVCMSAGETRDISNEALVKDLIGAGYVENVETGQKEELPEGDAAPGAEPAKKEPPAEEKPQKKGCEKG